MADQEMQDQSSPAAISQQTSQIFNQNELVTCARFEPQALGEDFSVLAASNLLGQVKLYQVRQNENNQFTQELVHEFKDHLFPVNDIAFCPHSRTVQPHMASCSDDTLINIYDINKQTLCRTFIGHQSYVSKIKFNNVTNVLLSCGTDNSLILWDIRTNKAIFKILGHPEPITSIDITLDNTMITSSSYDGYVRVWDMLKGTCLKTMVADSGSNSAIVLCKLTPNSKYMLFANLNNKLGLYNYQNDLVKEYTGHSNQEFCIEGLFVKNKATDKMMVLYGSEDGRVCGWDLNSQDQIANAYLDKNATEEGQLKLVSSMDYDPKFDIIGTCGNFKGLYINKVENLLNQQNL